MCVCPPVKSYLVCPPVGSPVCLRTCQITSGSVHLLVHLRVRPPVGSPVCLSTFQFTCVSALQVGDRDDSNLYISAKMKAAAEVRTHSTSTLTTTKMAAISPLRDMLGHTPVTSAGGGGVLEMYCSQPPGGHQHVLDVDVALGSHLCSGSHVIKVSDPL